MLFFGAMIVMRRCGAILASCLIVLVSALGLNGAAWAGEFSKPWHMNSTSIVLDAYEYTPIDWGKIPNNKRLAGFINKASDGLSPPARCRGDKLCSVIWKRYSTARELYHTRKHLAKALGLKWGAYHLARPGNPIKQARHFLSFAKPGEDDLIALDIEHNDPSRWMSLADAEIFARYIKKRLGRYPVLYTNHHTASFIARNHETYPLLSRLNLWYARYKPSVPGVFPMGKWRSYTIWQFSSMVNCSDRRCPWRIAGAGNWIDVNVVNMPPEKLKAEWPFARLTAGPVPKVPKKRPTLVSRSTGKADRTSALVSGYAAQEGETLVPFGPFDTLLAKQSIPPVMAVEGKLTIPAWRPGSRIVRRVVVRTSDEVASKAMRDRSRHSSKDALRKIFPNLLSRKLSVPLPISPLDHGVFEADRLLFSLRLNRRLGSI